MKFCKSLLALLVSAPLAVLVSPVYSNEVIGCQMVKGRPVEVVSYTGEQMMQYFKENTGPQTFVVAPFLYGKDCNDASNTPPHVRPTTKQ